MAWPDWIQAERWRERLDAHAGKALFVAAVASLFLLYFEYPPTSERARVAIEREYARAKAPGELRQWSLALVRLRAFVRNHTPEETEQVYDAHYRIALALEGQNTDAGRIPDRGAIQSILSELRTASESRAIRADVDLKRLEYALRLQELGDITGSLEELHLLDNAKAMLPGLNETIARTISRLPRPSASEHAEIRRRLAASREAAGRAPKDAPFERVRLWLEESAFDWTFDQRAESAAAAAAALEGIEEISTGNLSEMQATTLGDNRAEAHYALGRCALADNKAEEARGHFAVVLAAPETAWSNHARFGIAGVELLQGRLREALVGFHALANPSVDPHRPLVLDEIRVAAAFRCGDTFADLGDHASALEMYRKALTFVPPFPAKDLFDRRAWEQRLQQIRTSAQESRVLDLLEGVGILLQKADPTSIAGFSVAGGAAERERELAEVQAKEARENDDAAAAAAAMARADTASRRAGEHYRKGATGDISPRRPAEYYWRAGRAFVRGGFWTGASEMLTAYVNTVGRQDPNNRRNEAIYLLGRACQETGDVVAARRWFERNLSDPDMARLPYSNHCRLAQAEGDLARGQYESAINELNAVFTAGHLGPEAPEYRRALFLLGEAEYEASLVFETQQGKTPLALERLRDAQRHLSEALKRAPDDLPRRLRARFFLAAIAREINRMDDSLLPGQLRRNLEVARDSWREALDVAEEIERQPVRSQPERGYEEREIAPEALDALTRKAAFLLGDVHYEIALFLTAGPDPARARQEFTAALHVYGTAHAKYFATAPRTDLLWALIRMGRIAVRLGQTNDAQAHLEQAQFQLDQLVRARPTPGSGAAFDPEEWQTLIDEVHQHLHPSSPGGVPR
ncbi:MAG: hypothetical protein HYY93_16110 [Planctomycetes bacterium]|nr:hypothetical protein [Planctomycetota bacterium]